MNDSTPPRRFSYLTVDVFTTTRFGGNPVAVFLAADGLSDSEMQALSAEMNYSETTFVLPPADPANHARVRIFNRTTEMPFAGHPNVGTAFALAAVQPEIVDTLRFEEQAGLVSVRLLRGSSGMIAGAEIDAPQPLQRLGLVPAAAIAGCVGLTEADVVTDAHQPTRASVGIDQVHDMSRDREAGLLEQGKLRPDPECRIVIRLQANGVWAASAPPRHGGGKPKPRAVARSQPRCPKRRSR